MKESIMIVDDEQHILNSCKRILINENFDCHFYQSPVEALEKISAIDPAVVVSDQRMDEMQGIELLAKVRKIQPACVRILMTGYIDMESTIKAINEGHIFHYIKKPCSDTHLLEILQKGLAYYNLHQSIEAELDPRVKYMFELKKQERLAGVKEMAAAVCHEFSQPLQAISGYSGLLTEIAGLVENKEAVKEYLSIIQSQVERLGDLLLKVMTVKYYRTKPYSQGSQMVDLDRAACIENFFAGNSTN